MAAATGAVKTAEMTLLRGLEGASARISYHVGMFKDSSRVVNVISGFPDKRIGLILESTPFHPVDSAWPDQPADKGEISVKSHSFPVESCEIFAVNTTTQEVQERSSIPKKEREGWSSVIVHVIDPTDVDPGTLLDETAECTVDAEFRTRLNLQHSACHLAAFALNKACAELWKKEVPVDSLGNGDFDSQFNISSLLSEASAEDVYRIGKSGKKTFDVATLESTLDTVNERVNLMLQEWIASGVDVTIEADGDTLDDKRVWKCMLPDGEAVMPCGGTHVRSLSAFESIAYSLGLVSSGKEVRLQATTTAIPSARE